MTKAKQTASPVFNNLIDFTSLHLHVENLAGPFEILQFK
jgi:hypothetical protein